MKFNKDSKFAKIEAYAQGYYSNSEAYGEVYIPVELYEKYKESIDNMLISAGELDGKHSEVDAHVKVKVKTLAEFAVDEHESNFDSSYMEELDEGMHGELSYIIDVDYKDISTFTYAVQKAIKPSSTEITLEEDLNIQGVEFPKGTVIEGSIPVNLEGECLTEVRNVFNLKN